MTFRGCLEALELVKTTQQQQQQLVVKLFSLIHKEVRALTEG